MLRLLAPALFASLLLFACSSATPPSPRETPNPDPPAAEETSPSDGPQPFTEAEVDALLARGDCVGCHNARNDGPDMRSVAKLVNMPSGSRKNSACKETQYRFLIVPGDHEKSLLWRKVAGTHDCGEVMPQGGAARLTRVELDRLALYIDRLATYE
jgi:hypothetical protein